MGYITTVLSAEERRRAGPKNGAEATATIAIDPLGSISVHVASTPQGQGHRTVLAQVVADVFGLRPDEIRVVTELDTARDAWSIASGNYSSRFAPAVAGAAHLTATRLRDKLARLAAAQLNVAAEDVIFTAGRILARDNPDNSLPFARAAATTHWAPALLPAGMEQAARETAYFSPPELTAPTEADEINSSLCHGFIFDMCAVEIDRTTAAVRIDRYVTMHDCGRVLHPGMVAGQITGGFAHALGAALLEEHAYAPDGSFLSGTFADYLVPTAMEVPDPITLHSETRSPLTPLGAKGVGEGNCMSTPVCIANAVADALDLDDITLPLKPAQLAEHIHGKERGPATVRQTPGAERLLFGEGSTEVAAPREKAWAMLLDPDVLAGIMPGAHEVQRISGAEFRAEVTLGVGPVSGRYRAQMRLSEPDPPRAVTLAGSADGALGFGHGSGSLTLEELAPDRTLVAWRYEAAIGGKLATIGGRLLDGAARVLIARFFAALAERAAGAPHRGWFARLLRLLGRRA